MKEKIYVWAILAFFSFGCSSESSAALEEILEEVPEEIMPIEEKEEATENNNEEKKTIKILSLGDSYTIGESVCDTCRFPEQLKSKLISEFDEGTPFEIQVIARTGWSTTDLKNTLSTTDLNSEYDLVTLLIGVNNQFQSLPFSTFETEFNELVNISIALANGVSSNVVIISIPDYANTEFGQFFGGASISEEITTYNLFIKNYCITNNLNYIDAQNLIFDCLTNPNLIASDKLHPSELAYSNLVNQLLSLAYQILTE